MTYSLSATKRTEKGARVRTKNNLPAVVYGEGKEATSLTLDYTQFFKLYKSAGESSLIDLMVDNQQKGKVLIQDIQYDPVSDQIMHVDLRSINMSKPITATVELKFIGEAPVIKSSGGTLVTNVSAVQVECLPQDLVPSLEVDLSGLLNYDAVIQVKDLRIPSGLKIVDPQEEVLIVKATPAISEEEIKAMEEAATQPVDLTKIETVGKKEEKEVGEATDASGEEKKEESK